MATTLEVSINKGDADVEYEESAADYVALDLVNDYLIWTAGSTAVADGQDEPSESELSEASTIIEDSETQVAKCLLFDYSEDLLYQVDGMGENKKFVFCFKFDDDTATEPQLEAWDDDTHSPDPPVKHVLGAGTPADSMVKSVCTTTSLPGVNWAKSGGSHTELAGDTDVLLLNDGNGAIEVPSASYEYLYANIAIVIPASYATPAIETFVLVVRYAYS